MNFTGCHTFRRIIMSNFLKIFLAIFLSCWMYANAGSTTYQWYQLTDAQVIDCHSQIIRLANGVIWVVWESLYDGDVDLYGRCCANGVWSEMIEVAQDTNMTLLCHLTEVNQKLVVFGTETDLTKQGNPYFCDSSRYFSQTIGDEKSNGREMLAWVQHRNPYPNTSVQHYFAFDLPKVIQFDNRMVTAYHREEKARLTLGETTDSLFLKYFTNNQWSTEVCDSIFINDDHGMLYDIRFSFPLVGVNLENFGFFQIFRIHDWMGGGPGDSDFGLVIVSDFTRKIIKLNAYGVSFSKEVYGLEPRQYGSSCSAIFCAGKYYKRPLHVIRKISLENKMAVVQNEWPLDFSEDIQISQNTDWVAFVWPGDSALFVKCLHDTIWYQTQEIPLNGLQVVRQTIQCSVAQEILITFTGEFNENHDVYALFVSPDFEIDTLLTVVPPRKNNSINPTEWQIWPNFPNPFNAGTTLHYFLPQAGPVTLQIFDMTGRYVRTLVQQNQTTGFHSVHWDGRDARGVPVAAGIYFDVMRYNAQNRIGKLTLLR